MSNDNSTLVLIGGTGGLGAEVAKGLVTTTAYTEKKALVRSADKATALKDLGYTIVEFSAYDQPDQLADVLKGAHTVVSTLGGGDMATLEKDIVQAAQTAGASLFVPSQFGVDYRRWGASFPFLAGKKTVLEAAEKVGLPTLTVFTGYFSDWIFGFFCDLEKNTVELVGDGSDKVSFTRRSDIGFVLAKALEDETIRTKGGAMAMQGDFMSFNDAVKLLGKTLGKDIAISYKDPQQALKEEQDLLAKGMEGDMGAFYGSFKLHLLGEPARGNNGCDLTDIYNNYGVEMQTLEQVFASGAYGPPAE